VGFGTEAIHLRPDSAARLPGFYLGFYGFVQRYPYEPPKEIHSDKIRFFSFHEHLEQNENTWLMLCAQDLSSQVNVRICRRNIAGNKEYYKTAPLFLQKLNGLIKRHKPNLWNDKAKAAQMDNDATAVPYVTFYVEYYPEQDYAQDNEYYIHNYGDATPMEIIDVVFNPTEYQGYIHFTKGTPVSFHSKCKVLGQRSDTVQQFREPSQRSVPRFF